MTETQASIDSEAREAWIQLRDQRPHTRTGQASRHRVGKVLRFLGLPYERERQLSEGDESRQGSGWAFFTLEVKPQDVASIKGGPQYGSQANGVYHIFCLWEDARPDRIRANRTIRKLAKRGQAAVIVLCLRALTDAERQDIRRYSWAEDLSMAVLDDLLFVFLTRSTGSRLPLFFELSLPYSAANPYNPDTSWGARVPPEMFYGRRRLAQDLMTMRNGTSLVFGGRQLGKTALLRHVEEEFTDPDLRRFAWFMDLKDHGYVTASDQQKDEAPRNAIFHILHSHFVSRGILRNGGSSGDTNQSREQILSAFNSDQQLQILAMFDESDRFLESDQKTNFAAVESMRALMADTGNRFKVVFAGLHTVQRFANGPNNPFPNLGFDRNSPRRGGIGPLEDYEARQLVEEPFHILGFRFRPLVIDKILSYTNRHPSLIQFFCHELHQAFCRNKISGNPPFEISIEDVDRVYRTQGIQAGIKDRFQATFELDTRYRVIALAMILEQNRPTERWTSDRIRKACQGYCPWTFDPNNLDSGELLSLLNELIGLGILAQDGDHYRMRSSLIEQMFGSLDSIFDTLVALGEAEPFDSSSTPSISV